MRAVFALCTLGSLLGEPEPIGICTVSIIEPVGEVSALEPIDVRYALHGCNDGSPYIVTVAEGGPTNRLHRAHDR